MKKKVVSKIKDKSSKKPGSGAKKVIIIIILILLVLLISLSAIFALSRAIQIQSAERAESLARELIANAPSPDSQAISVPSSQPMVEKTDSPETIPATIQIPGYTDIHLTDHDAIINLINPEENSYNLKYSLSLTGSKYTKQTAGIEPGKGIQWRPYDNLPLGEYKLTINTEAIDILGDIHGSTTQTIVLTLG